MSNFRNIQDKLEQFIIKFYINELIKGIILFFSIGLLYLLLTLLIEFTLWLNPISRAILFWLFVTVELVLLVRLIVLPIAKIFKLKKGIEYQDASKIIGNHFLEVNDKLLNVLQLHNDTLKSELLIASIKQKSKELNPIPFKLAINFKNNVKYLKYAALPVSVLLVSLFTGHFNWFSDSYERVVNYQTAYSPPAPFQFFVIDNNLQAIENKDYKLNIIIKGKITPENAQITYGNETYYLEQLKPGEFEYVFTQLKADINFNLFANNITSKTYKIEVLKAPTLLSFDMRLDYPAYTKKKDKTQKSTGNAIVPEGTIVTWKLKTKSTDVVNLYSKDTLPFSVVNENVFKASKHLYSKLDYSLNASNSNLKDYESLAFSIDVIKDQYPEIHIQMKKDSLGQQTLYFYGQISDDYGLSKLQLIYYGSDSDTKKTSIKIPVSSLNFDKFLTTFPNQLNLLDGVSYDLYFQVFDNDALHNFKYTKSDVFSYRRLTENENENNQLEEQNETIKDLDQSLEKLIKQENELKELSKIQMEKSNLNFNDKKKSKNFLQRQKQQDEMMQNFNKKLINNLEEFQNKEKDQFKENLKSRLQENREQLRKDEKLLEEIEKLADKIQKEELTQKLEELAKQNKNKNRSLEQLLELTKRYYVSRKLEKLSNELEELSKEQEKLSEKRIEKNTKEKQEELYHQFEQFQEEMDELQKENKSLKEPIDVPQDKNVEEDIKKEQKEASRNLEKKEQSNVKQEQEQSQSKATKNQKKAARKMMKMSQKMKNSMYQVAGEQISEDIDMLRQILDNLVLFSFEQEALMNQFKNIQINHNEYANYLRTQKGLREHFEHVDDSLFALSLRQPLLSEQINKEITETFFNIDKSLVQLSENQLYQGVSAQQYTINSANVLASFLSDMLDNMEAQLNPQPGQGKGDIQLPDIIMSQEQLNKEMEEGLKKRKKSNKGTDEQKEDGKQSKDNKQGKMQQNESDSESEKLNGELFRIYQQQQQLRQALEDKLDRKSKDGLAENLFKQMEIIEQDLLNKGFTNRTLQKMMVLQHQLMKLENASFLQGEDNNRITKTNKKLFINTSDNQLNTAKQYFNTTELLNRQALPLQPTYKKKVQEYFNRKND